MTGDPGADISAPFPLPVSTRRTLALFPDDPSVHDVNVSVVATNVSVEFTKLSSFGNIDSFAGRAAGLLPVEGVTACPCLCATPFTIM